MYILVPTIAAQCPARGQGASSLSSTSLYVGHTSHVMESVVMIFIGQGVWFGSVTEHFLGQKEAS